MNQCVYIYLLFYVACTYLFYNFVELFIAMLVMPLRNVTQDTYCTQRNQGPREVPFKLWTRTYLRRPTVKDYFKVMAAVTLSQFFFCLVAPNNEPACFENRKQSFLASSCQHSTNILVWCNQTKSWNFSTIL